MKDTNQIPATVDERMRLRKALKDFVEAKRLCPPIHLNRLEQLAREFMVGEGASAFLLDDAKLNWLMVEIHNQLWLPVISGIPHERRLLMLPKCLSRGARCKAEMDEYGLLCHRCGACHIPQLQDKAEEMGSLSLVAEGFTQVIELIENNVVDAVIGVSCLESLEKAFPLLVRHAVPGLAVALNDSGCHDTHVDEGYVEEILQMTGEALPDLLNHDAIRGQVDRWFEKEELEQLMLRGDDRTSRVCLEWMAGEGKRWRPFLLAAVWQALTGKREMTEDVHRAAVAVECFHKASLIHDDIEDGDLTRYGKPTINALYGDTFAINAGDALLGEGYRILAATHHSELVMLIADAHARLCRGQGEELVWNEEKTRVDKDYVTHIARNKTVPAFEVALLLGLTCTGHHQHLRETLKAYSDKLGIGYQMKDDLDDFLSDNVEASRPSMVMALRNEHPTWNDEEVKGELQRLVKEYKEQSIDILEDIDNLELKRLLYQVTEKILG